MNYVEEQRNELEAVSEIYYNEIQVISNDPPISFSIKVRPQASSYDEFNDVKNKETTGSDGEDSGSDGDDSDEESESEIVATQHGPSVELKFELPPKYPDEKPSIQILGSNNLEEGELSELLVNLSQKAEESLGTVMVFTLVSDVVEWLITKSEKEADELEQEKEKRQKEIEAEEKKRFEGTPVTEHTFLAWKAKFDAEMLKIKLEQQKNQVEQASAGKRLTGRAMFESDTTLAESDLNFVEELGQNELEALLHNIDEVDLDGDEEFEIGSDDDENDEESEDEEFEIDDDDETETETEEERPSKTKVTSKR